MLLLRDVQKSDLDALAALARVLDTVNLPADRAALEGLVEASTRAFTGRENDPYKRTYLFVLEEPSTGALVGTSQVIAMHGTREAPHAFLDVYEREHYSAVIDRHFRHQVMRIGYNYEGFTEIGGLVVHPEWRGRDKPGKQLSWARFLYVAMHRERFRERVLAELLPPLLPDGRSVLWEALGRRFTGLTYQEADRLSRESKEFIKELFPAGEIYAALLPRRVQKVIGRVGPQTEGVRRMLESIGFSYDRRIDPFDGGPHYSAATGEVSLVRDHRAARVREGEPADDAPERLVGVERKAGRRRFLAVKCRCTLDGGAITLPREARTLLGVRAGDGVHTIPFS
jgi:arginine N-succinyltransferase